MRKFFSSVSSLIYCAFFQDIMVYPKGVTREFSNRSEIIQSFVVMKSSSQGILPIFKFKFIYISPYNPQQHKPRIIKLIAAG